MTGSSDGLFKVWDVSTGTCIKEFQHPGAWAMCVSTAGSLAATFGKDGMVRLWKLPTAEPVSQALQHQYPVVAVALSDDGKTLFTVCEDGTGRLWDGATGADMGKVVRFRNSITDVAFSADGKKIVAAGMTSNPLARGFDGTAVVVDVATCTTLGPAFLYRMNPYEAVAFGPDGNTVLTGAVDGSIRLWKLAPPMEGTSKEVVLQIQVDTRKELGSDGIMRTLDEAALEERRRQLRALPGRPQQ